MPETGLTGEIARWIADGETPGALAVRIAASGFADCVAVMCAGWSDPAATESRRIDDLPDWDDPLRPPRVEAARVALHLACAAHALDYDDTAFGGHPSAVLVPVLLAEVIRTPTDGAHLLAAYVAGYETWAELSSRETDSVHAKGWHPSAVYGPVAATAALAALRQLPQPVCRSALSLAASRSGGLVAQFGTIAKPWQLGRAARSAFEAAALAEAGMGAAPDALEHPLGFLSAISPAGNVRRDGPADLGAHMLRNGLNIKRYPVCYAMHRVLDGLERLTEGGMPDPADVEGVEVEIGTAQAAMLRHARPDTPAEAKFSIQFGVAAMLLRGRLGMAELVPDFIRSDEVRRLLPLVEVRTRQGRHPIEPSLAPSDRVTLRLKDRPPLSSGEIALPLGHFGNPAPAEALERKIADCLAAGPRPNRAGVLGALLADLPALDHTRALIAYRQEDIIA